MSVRPEPSRGYASYALGVLALANLLSFINRNVVFALFESIKSDLSLSDAQLGWLASAYVLVFSLAARPAGLLSDLRSRRVVIFIGSECNSPRVAHPWARRDRRIALAPEAPVLSRAYMR